MKHSAGILCFRYKPDLQVLLAHPGGPLWTGKDRGWWSIPKGELNEGEDVLAAALREFQEETDTMLAPEDDFLSLGTVQQSPAKKVSAWAVERDCEPSSLRSNTFSLEWPQRSGKYQDFPEIDEFRWFSIHDATAYILKGQLGLIFRLTDLLGGDWPWGTK